jgi:hypothetical protein
LEESRNREIALQAPPWPIESYVRAYITEAVARRKDGEAWYYITNAYLTLAEEDIQAFYRAQLRERAKSLTEARIQSSADW